MSITFENFFKGLAEATPVWANILVQLEKTQTDERRWQAEFGLRSEEAGAAIEASRTTTARNRQAIAFADEDRPRDIQAQKDLLAKNEIDINTAKANQSIAELEEYFQTEIFVSGRNLKLEQANIALGMWEIADKNYRLSAAAGQRDEMGLKLQTYRIMADQLVLGAVVSLVEPEKAKILRERWDAEDVPGGMKIIREVMQNDPEGWAAAEASIINLDNAASKAYDSAIKDLRDIMVAYPMAPKERGVVDRALSVLPKGKSPFEETDIMKMTEAEKRERFNEWAAGPAGMSIKMVENSKRVSLLPLAYSAFMGTSFAPFNPTRGKTSRAPLGPVRNPSSSPTDEEMMPSEFFSGPAVPRGVR